MIGGEAANENGGAEEDRTPDLRIANATLSQLSYGPIRFCRGQMYTKRDRETTAAALLE